LNKVSLINNTDSDEGMKNLYLNNRLPLITRSSAMAERLRDALVSN